MKRPARTKKDDASSARPFDAFRPATREWFESALGEPTRAQRLGWGPIARGESTLLLAPTGSGKTLAAFLAAIDRLAFGAEPAKKERCRVLYVSPLKALAIDVERNLRAPLAGVLEVAHRRGDRARAPSVVVRTGDTPQSERTRMLRAPPDILITTPETLYLLLTSSARSTLAFIDTVIVDEIHSMVATKRGAHLFLSLERLEALRDPGAPKLQRIGLSATQRPLDEVARLLGGFAHEKPRAVTIVDAGEKKAIEVTIEVPNVDLGDLAASAEVAPPSNDVAGELDEEAAKPPAGAPGRTIWPHIHDRIVELVRAHRSTMVFVNSRRLAERLAAALNDRAGEEIALAHHGSVAREKRAHIEDRLKRGDLPAIVATSSLELGIDMGAVDLVIQVESPPSVAAGMQRVGRASHQVGGTSRGILFPKHRADLLATATVALRMRAGEVEETFYPRNPLDVLAQQIVAIAAGDAIDVDDLFALVRRAAPFAELPRSAFESVLDMLSGRYPSDEFAELRARVTWDRARGRITARQGAQRLAIINGGTIPDRGLYGVFLAGGDAKTRGSRRVGELDEEMVFEMTEGDVFLLGASSWRADEITHDRVIVSPATGAPGKMPFWHGDRPGRPRALGIAIGELTRAIESDLSPKKRQKKEERAKATSTLGLAENAEANLVRYVAEELASTGTVPSDRTIVIERFADELGDHRVCVMTPFGARVHAPWAMACASRLRDKIAGDIETVWSDDGMVFRVPASDEPPSIDYFLPPSSEIEAIVTRDLASTSLFAARFRENAGRALLLPRRLPGKRTPLWAQRKRAADLLQVASRHPSFPILLETYRECLRDVFDMPALVDTLRRVESRAIHVTTVDVKSPSPFAASLLFSFVANFIYDGDAPLAERRAQALTIDHAQLRELLGEAELRQLLDPEIIESHTRFLQRLEHPARSADGVHDMLIAIGDLSLAELRERVTPRADAEAFVRELEKARRIVPVRIRSEARYIAAEDAGRLRDALGIVPPRGIPTAFLERVANPLLDVVGRYARTHGPFAAEDVSARFGLAHATAIATLDALVKADRIVDGAFRVGGAEREFCDAEVLRVLRRKSLARLRSEVEPCDARAFARFSLEWQGLARRRRGMDALLAAVGQLEGCPIPASELETILGARVEGFRAWDLDLLCASGDVVWAGIEPIGAHDGRIALYLADHEPLLARPKGALEGERVAAIRALLERRGAVFFAEIAREVGGFTQETLAALWDLVWAGEVTNDTLEPLRSFLRSHEPTKGSRRAALARSRGPMRPRVATRATPLGGEGRWSLRASRWSGMEASATNRSAALSRALLERYGVVMREAAHAEGIEGGFSAVYEVLKAMEDAGRARRGYFVAGRGATQFALPGAEERLRDAREAGEATRTFVVAATDPANAYGASLAWPERKDAGDAPNARPQRSAGARVILREGALLGWLGRSGENLLTFLAPDEPNRSAEARALAEALASMVDAGDRRVLTIASIDGTDANARHDATSPLDAALTAAGFVRRRDGYFRRASSASRDAHARAPFDRNARPAPDAE